MKICPKCEINHIQDNEDSCVLCKPKFCIETDNEARKNLLALLQSYGFFGFLHSTEFENFISIFKSKQILPRNKLTSFRDVANQGVICNTYESVKNCLRFYYKEKTPTNYKANYINPVMLVIDPLLIFDFRAKFASGNAGSNSTVITQFAEIALSFDWDLIFERGSFADSQYSSDDYYTKRNVIKNRRNAEFLYEGILSTDKIVTVFFKYKEAYNKAINIFGKDSRFQVGPKRFD